MVDLALPSTFSFLFLLSNPVPPSSAATEERSHQERSEYFITEVISFMFTPCVIVVLLILICFVFCGKMHVALWVTTVGNILREDRGGSCRYDEF